MSHSAYCLQAIPIRPHVKMQLPHSARDETKLHSELSRISFLLTLIVFPFSFLETRRKGE